MRNDARSSPVLLVDGVCKKYRKGVLANDRVSLTIMEGEIFGLLGPNGAGKTTLVNQIIGLARPDSGGISLDGVDIVRDPDRARQACSFQAQTQVPIAGLTPKQAIELVGKIRGGSTAQVRKKTRELLDALELGDWENKRGETLSGGVRRLVAFCMAAVIPGRLVILDEPTNDVDPLRRRLLWKMIRSLSEAGSAVLLVTHNVLEAERVVDRLAIMNQGKVQRAGKPSELKEQNGRTLRMEVVLEPRTDLRPLPDFFHEPLVTGPRLVARLSEDDMWKAADWASGLKNAALIEEFSLGPSTLEDAYLRIIGREETLQI